MHSRMLFGICWMRFIRVFVSDRKHGVHLLQGDGRRVSHGSRAIITHQRSVRFRHHQHADVQGV